MVLTLRILFVKLIIDNIFIWKIVFLWKNCLLIILLTNFLVPFKWTPLQRSLRSLPKSLLVKLLIDNIFIERLGLTLEHNMYCFACQGKKNHLSFFHQICYPTKDDGLHQNFPSHRIWNVFLIGETHVILVAFFFWTSFSWWYAIYYKPIR